MTENFPDFQELFDAQGNPLGALLGPRAWGLVREIVLARFAPAEEPAALVEPIQDWRTLVQFWDFKYPVDLDVACSACGNQTLDWEHDAPRKFQLTAANLGGLVTFRCLGCQAKIMKRHFKDVLKVEVKPFTPERCSRNLGRPD